jgi:hypothetical protein
MHHQQQQQQGAADKPGPTVHFKVQPSTALDAAQQLQAILQADMLYDGVGPGGLPVEEVVERLQEIMDAAFETNSAFDNDPAVTSMREGRC